MRKARAFICTSLPQNKEQIINWNETKWIFLTLRTIFQISIIRWQFLSPEDILARAHFHDFVINQHFDIENYILKSIKLCTVISPTCVSFNYSKITSRLLLFVFLINFCYHRKSIFHGLSEKSGILLHQTFTCF